MRWGEARCGEGKVYFVDVMVNYKYLTLSRLVCLRHKCTLVCVYTCALVCPPLYLWAHFVFKSHWSRLISPQAFNLYLKSLNTDLHKWQTVFGNHLHFVRCPSEISHKAFLIWQQKLSVGCGFRTCYRRQLSMNYESRG